jgi:predicted RNA-binding Zn-ribbon protein involved in translation (DUF1610 family)
MPLLLTVEIDIPTDLPPEDGGEDDDGEPIRWSVAGIFWSSPEVHLARLKLESEDIDCQIQDENIIAADFLLAPAVGGIKILVPEFEAHRARALLAKPIAASRAVPFNVCPECGSAHITRPWLQAKTFWAGVVALMFVGSIFLAPLALAGFVYYLIMWRPWRCEDCGSVFRRGAKQQGFTPLPTAEE